MVLSNTKLKRKKREEAAAVAVLNPPPDSDATPSVVNDAKAESPALLPAKKKKLRKSKAVNGDTEDGTVGSISEVLVDGNVLEDEAVPKSKKTYSAVGITDVTPTEFKDDEKALPSVEVNNVDGAAAVVDPGQDGAPKAKMRKKPRWELDENGKRVKPSRVAGESEIPSHGVQASTSAEGTGIGDANNGLVEKGGDAAAAVPESVSNGDRIHQGDEPWLQSKRSKKKKKLTDRWGKRLSDVDAGRDDHVVAPQVASSMEEEEVHPKKVVVGGMPYYISEDDIHEYFQECGTIAELDCMTFPDTGKFQGIAFITFRTEEAAKRALALDGSDMGGRFLKIEGCKIRCKEPARKVEYKEPPKKYEGCLSAYVGNLAWDTTEKELRKFFKGCKIDSIRFAEDKNTGEFRGFGHVEFADDQSLEAAMKLDQVPFLDRPLKISYSVPLRKNPLEARPGQSGDRKKGCFTCGEEGHMSYNCPKKALINEA